MSRVIKSRHIPEDTSLTPIIRESVAAKREPELSVERAPQVVVRGPDPREEYERVVRGARDEAERILDAARREADGIVADARRRSADIERQAHDEGAACAQQELDVRVQELERAADSMERDLNDERDRMMDGLRGDILTVALDVAEKIMSMELDRSDKAYISLLNRSLESIKADRRITIRVNPGEYVRFFKQREVTLHGEYGSIQATVLPDPTIENGGCVIETESGAVDAGAGTQLRQIAGELGVDPPEGNLM